MSATFRLAKQKPTQQELRRLMSEQKTNQLAQKSTKPSPTLAASSASSSGRIDSPLAKYNELGQLQCVLCKTIVRSADVWKVHINAKQHKQNIELAKQLKPQTSASGKQPTPAGKTPSASAAVAPSLKRPASVPTNVQPPVVPEKRLRGILKNSASSSAAETDAQPTSAIPSDFFDAPSGQPSLSYYAATMQKTSIRQDLISINRPDPTQQTTADAVDPNPNASATSVAAAAVDETLPEGFFDDPVKDAKARNLEYRDPVEEEWDRFQKEIKAAADTSNAIIAEDQVEATTERQIDEIDEQIRNWSRVLTLEKKKELVRQTIANMKMQKVRNATTNGSEKVAQKIDADEDDEDDDDDDDDEDGPSNLDGFLDWRAKRSQLKRTNR